MVIDKLKTPTIALSDEQQRKVAAKLLTKYEITNWDRLPVAETEISSFVRKELLTPYDKIKERDVLGPDNKPPEILEAVIKGHSGKVLKILKQLRWTGIFPQEWKMVRRTEQQEICLLNVLGKL